MGGTGGALSFPFALTADTSPTVLKPLHSLAIAEGNSSRFEIHFIAEMRFESPSRAPCGCESAVESRFFSE